VITRISKARDQEREDRFVPQVGAGCRIITYSKAGSTRDWALSSTWKGIASADVYRLTWDADPALVQKGVPISAKIPLTMAADSGYLVVRTLRAQPDAGAFQRPPWR